MPSRLKLRERLRLRPTSHDGANTSDLSTALSVRTVATTTTAPSTTTAAPSTITVTTTAAPSTRTTAALSRYIFFCFSLLFSLSRANTFLLSRNLAFTDALQQHLAKLSPNENSAFRTAHQTLTAESILVKVRNYDRDWNHDSNSRKYAEQVEKSLRILNQFLRSIAIAIQSNPEISLLIVGGVRFILDVNI